MKTLRNFGAALALICFSVVASAATTVVEAGRAHTAAGAFGCTISGATVATPSVLTCAAAHNFASGDQVQITGVGGTTTDNTTAFVIVLSPTTFSIYSDAALTTAIAGVGAYTSGGVATEAADVSGITGDYSIQFAAYGLTSGSKVLISIQDSADGFVSDVKTLVTVNLLGGTTQTPGLPINFSWRAYQLPSARVGVTNGRLRLLVQSIDGSSSVSLSLYVTR